MRRRFRFRVDSSDCRYCRKKLCANYRAHVLFFEMLQMIRRIKARVTLERRILNMLWMCHLISIAINIVKSNEYSIKITWAFSQNYFSTELRSDDAFSRLFQFFLLSFFSFLFSFLSLSFFLISALFAIRYNFFTHPLNRSVLVFVSILTSFLRPIFHHKGTRTATHKRSVLIRRKDKFLPLNGFGRRTHGILTYFQLPIEINYDDKLHILLVKHQM